MRAAGAVLMKFGEIPTAEAVGAVLAHSVRGKGIAFKKGRVLTADDVETLTKAGIEHTYLETEGAHHWRVWRRYLRDIAPLLFK